MITTFDLSSEVYKLVKATNILTVLNGGIYLKNRPLNSDKSDVVIGNLQIPNTVLQNTVSLINIYVKDIHDGTTYYPNLKVLNDATKILLPHFKERYIEDKKIYFDIETIRDYEVEDEGVNEHVSVIRLKTRIINI